MNSIVRNTSKIDITVENRMTALPIRFRCYFERALYGIFTRRIFGFDLYINSNVIYLILFYKATNIYLGLVPIHTF